MSWLLRTELPTGEILAARGGHIYLGATKIIGTYRILPKKRRAYVAKVANCPVGFRNSFDTVRDAAMAVYDVHTNPAHYMIERRDGQPT